jgi:hypothetical protein
MSRRHVESVRIPFLFPAAMKRKAHQSSPRNARGVLQKGLLEEGVTLENLYDSYFGVMHATQSMGSNLHGDLVIIDGDFLVHEFGTGRQSIGTGNLQSGARTIVTDGISITVSI